MAAESTGAAAASVESVIVRETGAGAYQVEARIGATTFLADEPVAVGGLGSGPNPYDLLSAALGSCTAMTIRLYANRKAWPLSRVTVLVNHHRGSLQARDTFSREIHLQGQLDEAQRTRLFEIAQRCPVHLLLDRGADVATTLAPPEVEPPADQTKTLGEHMKNMEEACDG
jgi:putative redox protein